MTEEEKLIEAYNHTKQNLVLIKDASAGLAVRKNQCEKLFNDAESALLKYMNETGQIAFECGEVKVSIRESEQVDIASLDAVPEEYVRVKEMREPNKALIKATKPKGNWYCIKQCQNINIKLKG